MKKYNKFYLIELIIFVFIIMFKILIDNISSNYAYLINIVFWIVLAIYLFIIGGFPRDKNYYGKSSIKIVLIVLLFYILIIYLLGLFIGFVKNLYFYDVYMMIKKVLPIALFISASEISRYLFFKHNPSKLQIIIFTIELIILNIIIEINSYNITSIRQLFVILSIVIIPIFSSEILCSYATYNIGWKPTIIYKLFFSLYYYVVPFNPDLSDYLRVVLGMLVPYFIYREIKNNLKYKEKYGLHAKKSIKTVSTVILVSFLGTMILLTSGIFKYQLIAIVTGSMEPIYYRGDAVIIDKISPDKVQVGDILVYKVSGGIITHRVIEINIENGTRTFRTKGDNNLTADEIDIFDDNIVGIVKYVVKYVGYPTVLLNDLLESK